MTDQKNQPDSTVDTVVDDNQVNSGQLTKKQRRELKKQEKKQKEHKQQQAQNRKSFLVWSGVLIGLAVVIGLIIYTSSPDKAPAFINNSSISEQDHVKGDSDATVTIIEYSDFQCPACGSYFGMLEQVEEYYGDKIAVVYRHYPLISIHPNAQAAAEASEAAGLQGKFWEMHDQLFINQAIWSDLSAGDVKDEFIKYADEIGLDIKQFKNDLDSNTVQDRVRSDSQSAIQSGLTGTPTFFVNGQKIDNPRSLAEFKFIIDNLLPSENESEPTS